MGRRELATEGESMAYEILREICRLAGYLLAHQAGITAEGEVAIPRALFTTEEKPGSAQLLVFESESYQTAVNNGRFLIQSEGGKFRCWVLAFDVNLRSPADGSKTGDAFYVEAGGRGLGHQLELMQLYSPKGEGADFHLIGDVIPVRREEWPPMVADGIESIGWHDLVADGARGHPLAGELWDKWH